MEKLDWFNRVDWLSLQEYEKLGTGRKFEPVELRKELHILDRKGKVLKGFYAARRLFILFPLTFIPGLLMYLPFASLAGNPVYSSIARNRHKFLKKKCEDDQCSIY